MQESSEPAAAAAKAQPERNTDAFQRYTHAIAADVVAARADAASIAGLLSSKTAYQLPQAFEWAQPGEVPKMPMVPTILQGQPAYVPPEDPFWFMETCPAKTGISVLVGGGMGLAAGVVIGGWQSYSPPMPFPGAPEPPPVKALTALKETGQLMSSKSVSWMKNFAKIGGIFSAVECVVEKTRGKHDIQNAVVSGCLAGAGLAYKQGAAAMAMGCGGFAAFSLVIDLVMSPH